MKITSFLFLNVYWLYFSFRHLLWQFNHADRFVELVTITWTSENTFTLGIRILKSLSNFSIDQNTSQFIDWSQVSIHYSIPNGSLTIENAMTLLSTKIKCVLSCTHYLQLDSVIFKFFTKKKIERFADRIKWNCVYMDFLWMNKLWTNITPHNQLGNNF